MRTGLLAVALGCAAITGIACGNAPGNVNGGTPLFAPPIDCSPTSPDCGSWKHIYACYFGGDSPIDGGCGGAQCHSDSGGQGATTSGFICGPTPDTCWTGLTMGALGFAGIVQESRKMAPSLFAAFYQANSKTPPGVNSNNMPLYNVSTMTPYTSPEWPGLTAEHKACISQWVDAGAPNN
jgi:hypothetical protein